MHARDVRSGWRLISIHAAALVLVAYFIQSATLNAKEEIIGKEDITDAVSMKKTGPLRYAGKKKYDLRVVITNNSKRSIRGPIVVAVKGTNVDSLSVLNADEKLDDKIPAFVLIKADAELKPGKSSKPLKIQFQAADRLTTRERREFKLEHKVYRLRVRVARTSSKDDQAGDKKKDRKTRERKGVPTKRTTSGGRPRRGGGTNDDDPDGFQEPSEKEVKRVMKAQDRFTEILMPKKGVVGTATGLNAKGKPEIKVFLTRAGIEGVPSSFEGINVQTQVTGELFTHWQSESPANARARFPRPVPIGVSVGNSRSCSSGTIACRVIDSDGNVFALSNNHVLGLNNRGERGDDIVQPGRADSRCRRNSQNNIGDMTRFVTIRHDANNNRIDAAIARVSAATLGTSTPSNGYGTPTSTTVRPRLRARVQKFGRTTQLTKGRIAGINATTCVNFGEDCTRFVGQIMVRGDAAGFIKSGDSGSLLVTDPDRQPCGLLFAGSRGGKFAVANPIDDVLEALGVTIDDGASSNDGGSSPDRDGQVGASGGDPPADNGTGTGGRVRGRRPPGGKRGSAGNR